MMQTDMKTKMRVLTLALLALSAKAEVSHYYMWGHSTSSTFYVPEGTAGANKAWINNQAAAYLYLGTTKIENGQLSLDGLTYVVSSTASNYKFGNYYSPLTKTSLLSESDVVDADVEQEFSLIIVTKFTSPSKKTIPSKLEIGDVLQHAYVYTGLKSEPVVHSDGTHYSRFIVDKPTVTKDFIASVQVVNKAEPVKDGGYVWGSSAYGDFRVPDQYGYSKPLTEGTATTYLFLGKVEVEDSKINLAKYKFITNSVPQSSGLFGNYSASVKANTRWFDDRIDFTQAQDFSILVVAKTTTEKMPIEPYKGYVGRLVGIIYGTSQQAETVDGAKYANMVVSSKLAARIDYLPTKEDVGGGVPGVTFVKEPGVMVIFH